MNRIPICDVDLPRLGCLTLYDFDDVFGRKKALLQQGMAGEDLTKLVFAAKKIDFESTANWFDSEKDGIIHIPGKPTCKIVWKVEIKTTYKMDKFNGVCLNKSQNWKKWDNADVRVYVVIMPTFIQLYLCEDPHKCKIFPSKSNLNFRFDYRFYDLANLTKFGPIINQPTLIGFFNNLQTRSNDRQKAA